MVTHMGGCLLLQTCKGHSQRSPSKSKQRLKQCARRQLPPGRPQSRKKHNTPIAQQKEATPNPSMIPQVDATRDNPQSASPKSYAGAARTPVPKGLPERPAQPPTKRKPARTSRVFVRLPEDSPLRAAHSLYIVKTVNSILPPGKGVEYTSPVRTGIALIPKAGTTPEDLLQHKERISKSLGDGIVERDENWVMVKIHDLPNDDNQLTSREVSIEEDIFPETAKAFDVTPETGCWVQKREGSSTSSIRLTLKRRA